MRRVIIIGVALAVAASCCGCRKLLGERKGPTAPGPEAPAAGAAPGLAGDYAGAGTNPDGSAYACDVKITPRGSVYAVAWYFDGRLGYEGSGILKGDTFVVGYAGPRGYGVVAYAVKADGSLDGTWTGKGATTTGTEKLTRK
jgi:hypothetical protein